GLRHAAPVPRIVIPELSGAMVEVVHTGVLGNLGAGRLRARGAAQTGRVGELCGELGRGGEVALEHLRGLPLGLRDTDALGHPGSGGDVGGYLTASGAAKALARWLSEALGPIRNRLPQAAFSAVETPVFVLPS